MPITIGSNIASLIGQRRVAQTSDALSNVFGRLSSGQRINKASDDAAGLAISQSLKASGRIYSQAIRNLNDGVSVLAIAEGSLRELSSVLDRQLELATQAANGTYSLKQRRALQVEADSLTEEFNRIVGSTSFNGQNLLDGTQRSLTLQAGAGTNTTLNVGIGGELDRAKGTGSYTAIQTVGAYYGGAPAVLRDVTGDGRSDAVFTAGGSVRTLPTQDDGSLGTPIDTLIGNGISGGATLIDDFNNDGKLDVIAYDQASATNSFAVLTGQGNGSFTQASTFLGAQHAYYAFSGDFNGDGNRDIAAVRQIVGESVSIYLGNGNGTFGSAVTTLTFSNLNNLAVGDLNADGKDDLFVTGDAFGDRAFLSNGNGTFQQSFSQFFFGGAGEQHAAIADFDRDGYEDVVTSIGSRETLFLKGRGDGTFNPAVSLGSSETVNGFEAEALDINADGYLDYVSFNASTFGIRYGRGDGTFSSVTSYSLASSGGSSFGDLNGDGVLDVIAVQFGVAIQVHLAETVRTSEIQKISILTQEDARNSIEATQATQSRVRSELGAIGAHQSRVQVATANLFSVRENYAAAESRITDVDVAGASADLTRLTILQQVGQAILSQANLVPEIALQLLRV